MKIYTLPSLAWELIEQDGLTYSDLIELLDDMDACESGIHELKTCTDFNQIREQNIVWFLANYKPETFSDKTIYIVRQVRFEDHCGTAVAEFRDTTFIGPGFLKFGGMDDGCILCDCGFEMRETRFMRDTKLYDCDFRQGEEITQSHITRVDIRDFTTWKGGK